MLLSTGLNAGSAGATRLRSADGVRVELADGRAAIDASNTSAPLGHGHPEVAEALRAAASSPVVSEGWDWPERHEAARELLDVAFGGEQEWVGAVRFTLGGSDANDLALSLAQALTGRTRLVTRERAYHGGGGLARDVTLQPQWHGGVSYSSGGFRAVPRTVEVGRLPIPRSQLAGAEPGAGDGPEIDPAEAGRILSGAAAVILDYSQGGVYAAPDYQDAVADAAAGAGALWIADEVVTGLGRTGGVWSNFERGKSRPDIVTLGKQLAGGSAPGGAVVVSKGVLEELQRGSWQSYGTHRAHPLLIAAHRATLAVIQREHLVERAAELGASLGSQLRALAAAHPSVTRVGGLGLHWTVELDGPAWETWHADSDEAPLASLVAERALDAGALIGTSGEASSLFLAPPYVSSEQEIRLVVEALHAGLELADELVA